MYKYWPLDTAIRNKINGWILLPDTEAYTTIPQKSTWLFY